MTVLSAALAAGAHPESFGLVPVESLVSPPDETGHIGYSTADMPLYAGWYPTDYDAHILKELFGPARKVAPDVRGWAFAAHDAPDFGVVLIPRRSGRAVPYYWDWGSNLARGRFVKVGKRVDRMTSAWLNALTHFEQSLVVTDDE